MAISDCSGVISSFRGGVGGRSSAACIADQEMDKLCHVSGGFVLDWRED